MDITTVDAARTARASVTAEHHNADDSNKPIEATVRVVGIDLDSSATGEVLATQFPTLIWEEHDNLITATMTTSGQDAISFVVEVCRRLESLVPGAKVKGVHRDFVNATDIAHRVGVSREAVRKWTSREGFPLPEDVVGGGSMKVWPWTEVVAWLRGARGIEMDQNLLTVKQMTQLENCLMRNPDHTTVQWQTAQAGRAGQAGPIFQAMQRGPGRRVVIDAASGRGHSSADQRRPALVGAGHARI